MKWQDLETQDCSLARALAVVGDRWTLLILRDAFLRVHRFEAFERRLGIARRILSERLNSLVEAGVLERVAYQTRPLRCEYRLTAKGLDLYPVVLSLVRWGDSHCAGEAGPPMRLRHKTCGCDFRPVPSCSECGEPLEAREVEARRAEPSL